MKNVFLCVSICLLFICSSCNNASGFETASKTAPAVQPLSITQPAQYVAPKSSDVKITKLIIKGSYPSLILRRGTTFSFPKDSNMSVDREGRICTLHFKNGQGIGSGSGITIITDGNNNSIVTEGSFDNSGDIYITNGKIIVNGKVISGKEKSVVLKPIEITIPDSIDLELEIDGNIVVEAPLSKLQATVKASSDIRIGTAQLVSLYISGSGTFKAASIKHVDNLDIKGSGNSTIATVRSINKIRISGSGYLHIGTCSIIQDISISGSGEIAIPQTTNLIHSSITGSGEITRE